MPSAKNLLHLRASRPINEDIMIDLREAKEVELMLDGDRVWLNVDGTCLLRVQVAENVHFHYDQNVVKRSQGAPGPRGEMNDRIGE